MNHLEKSVLISLQTETVLQKTGMNIHIIPYWKYWTIMKQITLVQVMSVEKTVGRGEDRRT